MAKGGRRSTSWTKGVSGNPSGRPTRPKTIEAKRIVGDVKAAARELTPQALETLQEIMEDKKAPAAARISAATEILSRGWGRPAQPLEAEAGSGTMSFLALVQASFSHEIGARARERASGWCLRDTRFPTRVHNGIPCANDPA
jgi:hypothetical protein